MQEIKCLIIHEGLKDIIQQIPSFKFGTDKYFGTIVINEKEVKIIASENDIVNSGEIYAIYHDPEDLFKDSITVPWETYWYESNK